MRFHLVSGDLMQCRCSPSIFRITISVQTNCDIFTYDLPVTNYSSLHDTQLKLCHCFESIKEFFDTHNAFGPTRMEFYVFFVQRP